MLWNSGWLLCLVLLPTPAGGSRMLFWDRLHQIDRKSAQKRWDRDSFTQGEIDFRSTQTRFQGCVAFLIVGSFYNIPEKGCLFSGSFVIGMARGSLWNIPHPKADPVNVLLGSMPWPKLFGQAIPCSGLFWTLQGLGTDDIECDPLFLCPPLLASHCFKLSASPWILG